MTDWSTVKVGPGIAEGSLSAGVAVAISGRRPETLAVATIATIAANATLPGSILTDGLDGHRADAVAKMRACIPQGRLGSPAEVAAAAQFSASAKAAFVTGQHLVIVGGQTLPERPDAA
ncbi:SDR family oxidoreductase [Mycobacterium sp. GA-2829]|uniref:SDR family oxidoreductase n=1 Tax=Mycobacterium sp. GA-2829 TaxID=1772283 RepID=UPI00073FC3DF|nr:SDR family oxidoreductase [Mycobacterium sp. GA-2829]KUI34654.1 hypothetical protein AU194_27960 [Mycobacterium sp. GA-2829]